MAELAENIERYRAKVNFQHKFKNVEHRFQKYTKFPSPSFFARNIQFYLHLEREEGSIFCDLAYNGSETGVSLNVQFHLSLISPSKTSQSAKFSVTLNPEDYYYRTNLSELFPGDEIIVDDAITLEVSLWAEEPQRIDFNPPKEKLRQELQIEGKQETSDAFSSLFDSGDFSDMSFVTKLDSSRVKAHKAILSARSPVFARMLTSDMKEAKDNEIVIDDMGAPALKLLLRHIYSGQLGFPKKVNVDLEICMELANAAEKYDLQKLKEYAAMAMTEFVSLENAWELLSFAKRLNAKTAIKALASYFTENVDKILGKA